MKSSENRKISKKCTKYEEYWEKEAEIHDPVCENSTKNLTPPSSGTKEVGMQQ